MGRWMRSVLLGGTALYGGICGFTYCKTDGKLTPYRMLIAQIRSFRIGMMGMRMGLVYKFSGKSKKDKHAEAAAIMKETFKQNGGLYIKLGQLIATLDILVPDEYVAAFRDMFQNAPTSEFKEVKRVFEETTGKKLEDMFTTFHEKPISSASIAQVHEAYLKTTGEKVAVKVQHEWLHEEATIDVMVCEIMATLGKKFFKDFDYDFIIKDMKKNVPQELDFTIEAYNAITIRKLFSDNKKIKVPYVYQDLSNKKVMTMEFVEGINIDHKQRLVDAGISPKEASELLADCFSRQIFEFGFIHADPHSGNVFARKVKEGGKTFTQLILLDHGLYKELKEEQVYSYSLLWKGILKQDEKMIQEASKLLGVKNYFMFAAMITNKDWDVIMDKKRTDVKSRLTLERDEETRQDTVTKFNLYMQEIITCFNEMDNDLLLVLKVNDYLRGIDNHLGNPVNSFLHTVKIVVII